MKKDNGLMYAPIDEKNVCSDWIEGVLDNNCGYTEIKSLHKYCGYMGRNQALVECSYTFGNNTLTWKIIGILKDVEDVKRELLSTLKEIDRECEGLVCEYEVTDCMIFQSFYFADDAIDNVDLSKEKEIKDRFGNVIAKGDKVVWYDPQTEYRDLSRVWVIEEINEEMAFISDDFGECECLPTEIAKVSSHYSKGAKLAVANQIQNMMYNNITYENGNESFDNWCANGEVYQNEGLDAELVGECMRLTKEITPIVDNLCLNYLDIK